MLGYRIIHYNTQYAFTLYTVISTTPVTEDSIIFASKQLGMEISRWLCLCITGGDIDV